MYLNIKMRTIRYCSSNQSDNFWVFQSHTKIRPSLPYVRDIIEITDSFKNERDKKNYIESCHLNYTNVVKYYDTIKTLERVYHKKEIVSNAYNMFMMYFKYVVIPVMSIISYIKSCVFEIRIRT